MAKANPKQEKLDAPPLKNPWSSLKEGTRRGILAVLFASAAIFFLLAALSLAGVAGNEAYAFLSYLLGYGYFLLPILFFFLTVSYARPKREEPIGLKAFGSLLFVISGLGVGALLLPEAGGIIGNSIASPLEGAFDFYASIVILGAALLISLFILFELSFPEVAFSGLRNPFKKKTEEGDDLLLPLEGERIGEEEPMPIDAGEPTEEGGENASPALARANAEPSQALEKGSGYNFRITSSFGTPFVPPPLSLLEKDRGKPAVGDVKANGNIIKRTLQNFGIVVEMDEISIGPSVTRYALKPAEGVKLSRIVALQNDLALALAAHPIRIEAPIPGKSLVGVEIPNSVKATVGLSGLLSNDEFQKSEKPLLVALGKGVSGKFHYANIAKMPHGLIAGATGSGKSVAIHVLVTSLLFRNSPENLRFIMVDPKRVELTLYNKIPHLLTPVITDAKKAIQALKWAAKEMDRRYDILEAESVRDIESYHKNVQNGTTKRRGDGPEATGPEPMPYIVIIIDELADIMQAYPRELEAAIVRLAQMSRAVGIHLLLSTQRPSVNVITGLIKANVPARIALQVASQIDSRTILDMAGAEKLLGAGDMLYLSGEMSQPQRIQSPFISEDEVKKVVKFLAETYKDEVPNEINLGATPATEGGIFASMVSDEEVDDDMYEEARETVIAAGKASTSYLQRKLGVGYARAARLMDILEEKGVIGPGSGSKPRDVLIRPSGSVPSSSGEAEVL
ncbi:MAG TPA: DNA translocase FtsK 4TM domain-containing protein [Candidatus Paceibacterota bacterium]|nr:DNA translocase FtsK 4TM domain-containing protein [Candidatus Paceibacterota bacterium]